MNTTNRYATFYRVNLALVVNNEVITIPTSDIVSIAFINNYDTMTFPIIRIRLYSDIRIFQDITAFPNDINIRGNLDGGIYRVNDEERSPVLVSAAKNIPFQLKVYIENKNTPTSKMDQYINGEQKSSDLNDDVKVPIELYCYDDKIIQYMKQKTQSIYKNMSILSIVEDIFSRGNINYYQIDAFTNQTKFDQILIPNLNVSQTLAFFDSKYGIYEKGAQLYGDIDKMYLCNTDVNNGTKPLPIYVDGSKTNNETSGLRKTPMGFYMETLVSNVSVMTETDIGRALHSPVISSINVNDITVDTSELTRLYDIDNNDTSKEKIRIPDIIHKSKNPYVTKTYAARLNETMTKIDVSGIGFDIGRMKINTRYNLIFETPIRGMSMNEYYRASFMCHVLSNVDGDLFVANTTMKLCSN